MRKKSFLLAIAVAFIMSGCGSTVKVITGTVGAAASRVSSPALIDLGLGNHDLSLTNGTNFWGQVIVNGQKVDSAFRPGQSLYANWGYQPNSSQIPVSVFFFENSAGTKLVGVADYVFRVGRGQTNTSDAWTIRNMDITTPSGRKLPSSTPDPSGFSNFKSKEMKFKRTTYGGTTIVQVANLTPHVVVARIDGRNKELISPSGYAWIKLESVGTYTNYSSIQFVFVKRGVSRDKTVFTPSSGVRAECIILTDRSILK